MSMSRESISPPDDHFLQWGFLPPVWIMQAAEKSRNHDSGLDANASLFTLYARPVCDFCFENSASRKACETFLAMTLR